MLQGLMSLACCLAPEASSCRDMQHPGPRLVLASRPAGEICQPLSFTVVVSCIIAKPRPGARDLRDTRASKIASIRCPCTCAPQVVGMSCLLGVYVEEAEPRGAPNMSQRDLTVTHLPHQDVRRLFC